MLTALRLFNEEGETAVSAVDIANEMGISPGNLYYHYKGKEEIVPALAASFHEELMMVLDFAGQEPANLERLWIYIYIILEEIYDFRFLYLNLDNLTRTYPQISDRIRSIFYAKRRAITLVVEGLEAIGAISIPDSLRDDVEELLLMAMTFWLQLDAIDPASHKMKETIIHASVYRIMILLLPYQTQDLDVALQGLYQEHLTSKD